MIDESDKNILEYQLSSTVGKAVSHWMKQNGVVDPVVVQATVSNPSCYVDECGVVHTGPLITCDVTIVDDDNIDDDKDY